MKATLIREQVYTLKAGEKLFTGLRVKSHWNGLTDLRNEAGGSLIVSGFEGTESTFDSIFLDIFRSAAEVKSSGVEVVMASPSLMAEVMAAAKAAEAPNPTTTKEEK